VAIKLIIADDEPLVLVGLQSMLNYDELGIKIVSVARNGKQLEEAINTYNPDLVITDIKMPIKSGLEVLKHCRSTRGKLPLFIMLTSFEEFAFVKEALKYQAVDYLVKLELTEKSLKTSITKALSIIQEIQAAEDKTPYLVEKSSMQPFLDKFFVRLFNGLIETRENFTLQKEELGIDLNYPAFLVCYCEITESRDDKLVNLYYSTTQMIKETIRCYLACHITSLDMHHLAITFCLTKEQALHAATIISQVLEKTVQVIYNYFSVKLVCCVGTKVEDAFSLSDSFFAARQLMEQATADHPILFYDRQIIQTQNQTFNLADFREQLTKAFEELDALALKKVLNDVANSLETQEASRLQGIEAASNILYMAITLLPDGQQLVEQVFQDEQLGYRKIYKMNNVNQCAVWLRTLGNGLEELLLTRRQDYRAKVIANIQQYIKDNLGRKLQLGEVALLFGFSQNYLSSLFSKYGGCSFVEYTTNAKIQAAKDMMASGDYKMYEISDKLGFENAFYFSKVFKKVEGKSPREYLHQLSRKRN